MVFRRLVPVLLFAAALALPARAAAALNFSPCPHKAGVDCATLTVPIDRSGNVPGTFALHVERVRGGGRGALLAMRGGPGDVNTDATLRFAARFRRSALRTHDLYVFDQRGTGQSGALHCAGIESGAPPSQAVPACAAQLGPARNYYTTLASAQDIETLRQAIGAAKLAIYGISYGTYLAQAYAGLYPDHVESLVLDSAYAPSHNADAFQLKTFQALPGVLRSICARGACRGIISNFQQGSYALLSKLGSHPLKGTWYDARGHGHDEQITALGIAASFPNIDVRPNLRAELPRALAAAMKGDTAPVARLVAGAAAGMPAEKPDISNQSLNIATLCEERDFGFDRTASPAEKLAQAQAELAQIPPSAFAPFPAAVAFAVSLVPTCAYWPMLPTPPTLPTGTLPAVPTLILHGEADLRTGLDSAREVAARIPGARLLTVPHVGHAVLQADDSGCALRALAAFYSGRPVRNCGRVPNPYPPRPLAPRRRPAGAGGVIGAARLTVQDAFEQADPGIFGDEGLIAAGGLRGGSYRLTRHGMVLRGDVFVPGVRVSGLIPRHGRARLTVSGVMTGKLLFAPDGGVSGRLDGRAVHARARLVRETVGQRLARSRAQR